MWKIGRDGQKAKEGPLDAREQSRLWPLDVQNEDSAVSCSSAVYQVARGGGQEAEATRQLGSIVGLGRDMMEPADIFHI